jgi:hypothetical protein
MKGRAMHKAVKSAAALGLLIWCSSVALPAQALFISASPSIASDDESTLSPTPTPTRTPKQKLGDEQGVPADQLKTKAERDAEKALEKAQKEAERAQREADKAADQTKQLREKFGTDDQLVVPPLVVKKPKTVSTPKPTATAATSNTDLEAGIDVDAASKSTEKYVAVPPGTVVEGSIKNSNQPIESGLGATGGKSDIVSDKPIEISGVNPSAQTPADTFISAATYGLGAMAAGAVALGAFTLIRGSRRKSISNPDFTYTSGSN